MPQVEKCFIRMPAGGALHTVAGTPGYEGSDTLNYFSLSDARILITEMTPSQKDAARSAGAQVFDDFQFQPWIPSTDAGPAGPEPYQGKALVDVVNSISATQAWTITRGAGVTIVLVDSGVDATAMEFPANRRSSLSFSPSYADGPWNDVLGHGSMVASVAAGSRNAGGKYDGVAPEATILSARTNYSATDLYTIYDRLITMKKQGLLTGPVIVNNSYATSLCASDNRLPPDHPYAEIIRLAFQGGLPMIFACGNNHAELGCNNQPTECSPNTIWAVNSLDEVISVGAINWDNINTVGAHGNSSRGPGQWAQLRPKPDVVAPCYGQVLWGHSYRTLEWWGTSGAAPVVTGVAALTLAAAQLRGRTLTPTELCDILRRSCDSVPGANTCVGHGRINAATAVSLVNEITPNA